MVLKFTVMFYHSSWGEIMSVKKMNADSIAEYVRSIEDRLNLASLVLTEYSDLVIETFRKIAKEQGDDKAREFIELYLKKMSKYKDYVSDTESQNIASAFVSLQSYVDGKKPIPPKKSIAPDNIAGEPV